MTAFAAITSAFRDADTLDGSLTERLEALQRVLATVSPDLDEAYRRLVSRLKDGMSGGIGPQIGDAMPDFLLPNDSGGLTGLSDLLGAGPAVVSFNRGHWCHHCMLELFSLARVFPAMHALHAEVVSIVPERQRYSRELKSRCQLPFPVLSDMDNAFGLSIGLAFPVGKELQAIYQDNGLDFTELQGCETWLLPVPATFVLDQSGIVRARFVDPDFRKRAEPDQIIAALESL